MYQITIILCIGLSFYSCANGMIDADVEAIKDQQIHMSHNANIMRQISNDMIIQKTLPTSNADIGTHYFFDKIQLDREDFLAIPLDSIFYVAKMMNIGAGENSHQDKEEIRYIAYSLDQFNQYQFVPKRFDVSFNEIDELVLQIEHPIQGELFAYGFDKQSGKQAIKPYYTRHFDNTFSAEQGLFSRQIDELRIVMTLADSIYIHDFKIEDFYTHDH